MSVKELESLIKNTLKVYVTDYNNINPENKVDFNLSFTTHRFDTKEVPGYDPEGEQFQEAKRLHGKELYYLRLSKTLVDKVEKRVIFTAYREVGKLDGEIAHRAMLLQCIRQMLIGGLEYSEAIYRMHRAEQGQKENQKEPLPKAV